MKGLVVFLFLFSVVASEGQTATFRITFTATNREGTPCPGKPGYGDSTKTGQPETSGVSFYRVRRVRYADMDTSVVLDIAATPPFPDSVEAYLPTEILGTLGQLWTTVFDFAGNESCPGMKLTYAIPLEEAAPPLPAEPPPSPAPVPVPGVPSNRGLLASYFSDPSLGVSATQVDSTVDFSWADGPLWPGGPSDNASVRWSGVIMIPRTGDWTYCVASDDGHRLKSDGVLRIDKWGSRWEENCWTGWLSAGAHAIEIEYLELGGGALCEFRWSGPGVEKQIVPAEALSH